MEVNGRELLLAYMPAEDADRVQQALTERRIEKPLIEVGNEASAEPADITFKLKDGRTVVIKRDGRVVIKPLVVEAPPAKEEAPTLAPK